MEAAVHETTDEHMSGVIYLDYHATTPCDPRVVAAMLSYFDKIFGNPASSLHVAGRAAATAVEKARQQVAELIGARPEEIVFTSGATESNNLAIFGVARAMVGGVRRKIVTTPIEHKSVLEPCAALTRQGFDLVMLPVDGTGTVDVGAAEQLIDGHTLLVSVQAANNEIGTIQPIIALAQLARRVGAVMHCDAAQAAGKIPLAVEEWGVDLLSISGHKLYGPKGVGALYVRGGRGRVALAPLLLGGGQEDGLRAGTANVPAIVGFGEACALCQVEMAQDARRVGALRDELERRLRRGIPDLRINGNLVNRLPGNSSLTFPGIEADALILNLPQLALSTGSACHSGALEPSYVLTAIGLSRELASSTVRVGLGRFTTEDEIHMASSLIINACERLASLAR
jgi:cysteine desulfurase